MDCRNYICKGVIFILGTLIDENMKHNLSESYLKSLTEQQRIDEMKEWSASEVQQYLCPNGTMTLEEFRQKLYNKVDEMILKKYGSDYIE